MIRTTLAALVAVVALGIALPHADRVGDAAALQPPQQRQSWQAFSKDPAKVKSLVAAFAAMRANDSADPASADYRRSLQYWGAIHSYYGPSSPRGVLANAIARMKATSPQFVGFFAGLTDLTPPDALAVEIWNRCQHSFFTNNNTTFVQAQNFFGWHRIYLYYFEQVLRTLSKDNTLRLPYWDYTDPAQVAFPAAFGTTSNPNNPLFDSRRNQGLNDGLVVINDQLTNVDGPLDNPQFLGEDGFSWAIEGDVHGIIHCAVGNTCPVPLMGSVALSANDPIFWLHHANIDRLWDCWINRHGAPTGPWDQDRYAFPDGNGVRQERMVAEFVKPSTEYVYDKVSNCSRVAPISLTAAPSQGTKGQAVVIASATKVSIDKPTGSVKLSMAKSNDALKGLSAGGDQPAAAVDLVLTGITADKSISSLINVYVAGPGGQRQRVGTINFFGQGEGEHDHAGLTRRFDVTRQVRELSKADAASELTISFEPESGVRPAPGKDAPTTAAKPPSWSGALNIATVELQLRPRKL